MSRWNCPHQCDECNKNEDPHDYLPILFWFGVFPFLCFRVLWWWMSYRAPIGQGYGLTETCAGGTFSEFDDSSVGRVGNPVPSSFIKVRND